MRPTDTASAINFAWRHLIILAVFSASLVLILLYAPINQPPDYHNFGDQRTILGVPNFYNVASNLAFVFAGLAGLKVCMAGSLGGLRNAWLVLFGGITLVSVGSAYYHLDPNAESLVWDRLPMTIGFMGLFVALLGEYVNERLNILLVPAILVGLSSVVYWHLFDDLRFYIWVQMAPLLAIPLIMILFRAPYSHQPMLLGALGMYLLAKISEFYDVQIFEQTGRSISGHTLKHLLSALGCGFIVLMLQNRSRLESPDGLSYDINSD